MKKCLCAALCAMLILVLACPSASAAYGWGDLLDSLMGSSSKEEEVRYSIGETVETEDVKVILLDVKESRGGSFFTPESGNVFLICTFEIQNCTKEEMNISSLLCFEAYCDDYNVDLSLSAECSVNASTLDGNIAPGKKMKGIIGYEVPAEWKTLEIHFTPEVWFGDTFVFYCEK